MSKNIPVSNVMLSYQVKLFEFQIRISMQKNFWIRIRTQVMLIHITARNTGTLAPKKLISYTGTGALSKFRPKLKFRPWLKII